MSKQDCIIDACSYIYLNKFKFIKNSEEITPFELLKEIVNIKHHRIISNEIKRNYYVSQEESMQINNREYDLQKYDFDDYDKIIFNNQIENSESTKDLGEKANLMVAIDIILKKKNIPIFLTDDNKAIDFINQKGLFKSFLLYSIWTSFDVIIFLFITCKNFRYNIAIEAINDLTVFLYQPTFNNLIKSRDDKIAREPKNKEILYNEFSKKINNWRNETEAKKLDYLKRLQIINSLQN